MAAGADFTISYQAPWYHGRSVDFGDFQALDDVGPVVNYGLAQIAANRPAGGRIVIVPGVYNLATTIAIGDGTSSAKSTYHGVELIGLGARGHGADELAPRGAGCQLVWTGSAGGTMVQVNGPISNLNLDLPYLDCAGIAGKGLVVHHAMNSNIRNVFVTRATDTGIVADAYSTAIASVASGGNGTEWRNINVSDPVGSIVHGMDLGAASDDGAPHLDIAKNYFTNLNLTRSANASASSLRLRFIDNCSFDQLSAQALGGVLTGNAIEIIPPTGATTFPKNITMSQAALQGSKTVTGSWTGAGSIVFAPLWVGADDPTLPAHTKFEGFTTQSQPFGRHIVRKPADTTISADNTANDDPDLKIVVNASESWEFTGFLYVNAANATMDMTCGWTVPAGTTMAWGPLAGTGGFTSVGIAGTAVALLTESQFINAGTLAGLSGVSIAGRIRVAATAGTVQFRWAQTTSDAGNLTLEKDSWLQFTRVA